MAPPWFRARPVRFVQTGLHRTEFAAGLRFPLHCGSKGPTRGGPRKQRHIRCLSNVGPKRNPFGQGRQAKNDCSNIVKGDSKSQPVVRTLGNGIGSTGQAQEIPDNQEHNPDQLRKRRRDMEQAATQHAAKRRSDESEKRVDTGGRAATSRWYPLRQKGRQDGLIETIAKEKGSAAGIEQEVILSADEIECITESRGQPADKNWRKETTSFLSA